jgi:hypothetical protein
MPPAGLPHERGARVAADDRITGAAIAGQKPGAGNRRERGNGAQALRVHHARAGSGRGTIASRWNRSYRILGSERTKLIERVGGLHDGLLNMTFVALRLARYVNGVATQHGKVSSATLSQMGSTQPRGHPHSVDYDGCEIISKQNQDWETPVIPGRAIGRRSH